MSETVFCSGLYELVDSYDGFILDQWGVLHNGVQPYEGVIDALEHLRRNHKKVIILSNSAKRAVYNIERLKQLGIRPNLYQDVVTAGEVAWQGLREKKDGIFHSLGKRCFLIARGNDKSLLQGLDNIEVVPLVEESDFVLITGTDAPQKKIEDYESDLRKAVARRIPAICANPDLITVFGSEQAMGPGAIAKRYQELGGVVNFIGKPHKMIFRHCVDLFEGIIPSRILVVGDSLYHDVAGGLAVNLDTAFVLSGIHEKLFNQGMAAEQKRKTVDHLIQNYGARTNWVLDSLVWQTEQAAQRERERLKIRD